MIKKQQGFTLIELLVVVVIVAILFTYTTLAIRGNSAEDFIKEEAQRLERLVQLAMEEAILRGEEYGLEVYVDGYRFLRFSENEWLPLASDRILRERKLSHDIELEMRLEDTAISMATALDAMSDNKVELDDNIDEAEDAEKVTVKPQVFLLSSGEITPEFDIRFFISGVETSYIVRGLFDGTLKTEVSDL